MGKKVVFLDFGGVIGPDSHVGAYNQKKLEVLTGLTSAELNALQDHPALNLGDIKLTNTFELIAKHAKTNPKPTPEDLLAAYKEGVSFYPGTDEMIRELHRAGYRVCLLTNNSYEGIAHVRDLLRNEGLSYVTVYGSAEMRQAKPNPLIFIKACADEGVHPRECWFVDDRNENYKVANELGLSVIRVARPETPTDTAIIISTLRKMFSDQGVLHENHIPFSENFNRGKFPSLFGIMGNAIVMFNPAKQEIINVDRSNPDGNPEKRCEYESHLAKLIVESGVEYWLPAYQKINQLFLLDFDKKNNATQTDYYKNYFLQIEKILKKEGVLKNEEKMHTNAELKDALETLFSKTPFDLTAVSQFYYGVWLLEYGHAPLEPFVFLVDGKSNITQDSIRMLTLFPNMAHSRESREDAYLLAQNWLTCGTPQLRGRKKRENTSTSCSNTIGIMRDDDRKAEMLRTKPHPSAKAIYAPDRSHPISQQFQAMGAPIIGGSSGTLGRNIYMLAPLVATGLLTIEDLMRYFMGFAADLVYRGHHSFEEIAIVAGEILRSLRPDLDPVRETIKFYEQLLTEAFVGSREYQAFRSKYEHFFETPLRPEL